MSEAMMAELTAEGATAPMRKAHSILTTCGSISEGQVQLVRGVNHQGKAFGQIIDIQKCLNPVCPYCGPELLQAQYTRLTARRGELKRSGELDGCITYAGAFTCQHRDGDDIAGLIKLLRGAELTFRRSPAAKELIAGWVCGTEVTTGLLHGNGAHPHTQFLYTLNGTATQSHDELWEEAEAHFRAYFQDRSEEIIGAERKVLWKHGWVSPEGPGLTGFYGRNPAMDWDLIREVSCGNMKNGGIWNALSPDEFAEFFVAMDGGKLHSIGGCWAYANQEGNQSACESVASILPARWDRLHPETKRMIRTITMCPDYWTSEEVKAYADLANQDFEAALVDEKIRLKFFQDSER